MRQNKVLAFLAMSIDGFIAGKDGDLAWLDEYGTDGNDYGYNTFYQGIDKIIMGKKTYDKVMSFGIEYPHQTIHSYILTHQELPSLPHITFYSGLLTDLIQSLQEKSNKHIYCDGGAQVIQQMINEQLLDEITITLVPKIIGDGIRLFNNLSPAVQFQLQHCKSFNSGIVQLHYILHYTNASKIAV
jgi:dihydrofolate reductase